MAIIVTPNTASKFYDLEDFLREKNAEEIKEATAEVERRKQKDAAIDSETDFAKVKAKVEEIQAAAEKEDSAALFELLESCKRMIDGGVKVPAPYEPNENLEGLKVRFVALSEADRATLQGAVDKALRERAELIQSVTGAKLTAEQANALSSLNRELNNAVAAYVQKAVKEIDGMFEVVDGETKPLPASLPDSETLERSGMLTDLFVAARHFQGLSPKKALAFGQPQPSILQTSIAAPAPKADARK